MWKKVIGILILIIFIGVSYLGFNIYNSYYKYSYTQNNNVEEFSFNSDKIDVIKLKHEDLLNNIIVKQEEIASRDNIEGIKNILLLSSDARPGESLTSNSRSDSIIILTIDTVHNKIKLSSLLRDTLVQIPNVGEQKLNHAFAYGGANLIMKTIEDNFGIKLDKYIIVGFEGFKALVDKVGGIEINVPDKLLNEVNKYIIDTGDNDLLNHSGLQKLSGSQALSYARIRKVDTEYARTERQREVITKLINKIKDNTSILQYPDLLTEGLKYVKTNMDFSELLSVAYTVNKIGTSEIQQLQIPINDISVGGNLGSKGWVIVTDKKQNADILGKFIFDDTTLKPYDLKTYKDIYNQYVDKYVNMKSSTINTKNNTTTQTTNSNTNTTPTTNTNSTSNMVNQIDDTKNSNENSITSNINKDTK